LYNNCNSATGTQCEEGEATPFANQKSKDPRRNFQWRIASQSMKIPM